MSSMKSVLIIFISALFLFICNSVAGAKVYDFNHPSWIFFARDQNGNFMTSQYLGNTGNGFYTDPGHLIYNLNDSGITAGAGLGLSNFSIGGTMIVHYTDFAYSGDMDNSHPTPRMISFLHWTNGEGRERMMYAARDRKLNSFNEINNYYGIYLGIEDDQGNWLWEGSSQQTAATSGILGFKRFDEDSFGVGVFTHDADPYSEDPFFSYTFDGVTLGNNLHYYLYGQTEPNQSTAELDGVFWGVEGFEVQVVPVPAAVWLLGSGLLGLIGIRRKMKN